VRGLKKNRAYIKPNLGQGIVGDGFSEGGVVEADLNVGKYLS